MKIIKTSIKYDVVRWITVQETICLCLILRAIFTPKRHKGGKVMWLNSIFSALSFSHQFICVLYDGHKVMWILNVNRSDTFPIHISEQPWGSLCYHIFQHISVLWNPHSVDNDNTRNVVEVIWLSVTFDTPASFNEEIPLDIEDSGCWYVKHFGLYTSNITSLYATHSHCHLWRQVTDMECSGNHKASHLYYSCRSGHTWDQLQK